MDLSTATEQETSHVIAQFAGAINPQAIPLPQVTRLTLLLAAILKLVTAQTLATHLTTVIALADKPTLLLETSLTIIQAVPAMDLEL